MQILYLQIIPCVYDAYHQYRSYEILHNASNSVNLVQISLAETQELPHFFCHFILSIFFPSVEFREVYVS